MYKNLLIASLMSASVAFSGSQRVVKQGAYFPNPEHFKATMVTSSVAVDNGFRVVNCYFTFSDVPASSLFFVNNDIIFLSFYNQPEFLGFNALELEAVSFNVYSSDTYSFATSDVLVGMRPVISEYMPEFVFVPLVVDLPSFSTVNSVAVSFIFDIDAVVTIPSLSDLFYFDNLSATFYKLDLSIYNFWLSRETAYDNGFAAGEAVGYDKGLDFATNGSMFSWIESMFRAVGNIFNIQLFKGFTIGSLALIMIVFALVPFILSLFKGGGK